MSEINPIPVTEYAVLASCMANNGARAKSLAWSPLGDGREWSRTITVQAIDQCSLCAPRVTIFTRSID